MCLAWASFSTRSLSYIQFNSYNLHLVCNSTIKMASSQSQKHQHNTSRSKMTTQCSDIAITITHTNMPPIATRPRASTKGPLDLSDECVLIHASNWSLLKKLVTLYHHKTYYHLLDPLKGPRRNMPASHMTLAPSPRRIPWISVHWKLNSTVYLQIMSSPQSSRRTFHFCYVRKYTILSPNSRSRRCFVHPSTTLP